MNKLEMFYMGVVFILAVAEGYLDGYLVREGKKVTHVGSAILRVLFCLFCSWGVLVGPLNIILYTAMLLTLYWIVFDIAFNIFRYQDISRWRYIGATSQMDRIARKMFGRDGGAYLSFKLFVLVVLGVGFVNFI